MKNNLRAVRQKKRVLQFELSRATGIFPSTLTLIENGYIQPSETIRDLIAAALDSRSEEIFPNFTKTGRITHIVPYVQEGG